MHGESVDSLPAHMGYGLRPMPGEQQCGDQCAIWFDNERVLIALADGLGHGSEAAQAADAALSQIGAMQRDTFSDIFQVCDLRLRGMRGAALALALIEPAQQRLLFAAVGNIRAVVIQNQRERRLGATRGIVGAGYAKLVPEIFTLNAGDSFFLYSDGFDELLPLRELIHPGVTAQEIAEHALQRWAKPNDDASILVYLSCTHNDCHPNL